LILSLISEASQNGDRLIQVCETIGISKRTYERWCKDYEISEDKRRATMRPEPKNELSREEYQSVLNLEEGIFLKYMCKILNMSFV